MLAALSQPFKTDDIEWRVLQADMGNKGPWAKVVAYINNRAIMDRLDTVIGANNWRNEFRTERIISMDAKGPPEVTAMVCGLSLRIEGEWITKWDASDLTDVEPIKGAYSTSMKRAGVQWGIGRYLYNVEQGWAKFHEEGMHTVRIRLEGRDNWYRWDPPPLPEWARVEEEKGGEESPTNSIPDEPKAKKAATGDWRDFVWHWGELSGRTLGDFKPDDLKYWQDNYHPKPYKGKISAKDKALRQALDDSMKENGVDQSAPNNDFHESLEELLAWSEVPPHWLIEKLVEIQKIPAICTVREVPEGVVKQTVENFQWFVRKWESTPKKDDNIPF